MNQREKWIDVVKAIGIILMVIGQASPPFSFKIWIYSFHMPLFFIVAGYLFNEKKWASLGEKELLKSRAKTYLLPYI